MAWLQDVLSTIWRVFTTPSSVTFPTRAAWSIGVLIVILWLGLLIVQGFFLEKRSGAFYPKERFRIALAWSFLTYASFLTVLTASGWWFVGRIGIRDLWLHVFLMLASLIAVLACLPRVPKRMR